MDTSSPSIIIVGTYLDPDKTSLLVIEVELLRTDSRSCDSSFFTSRGLHGVARGLVPPQISPNLAHYSLTLCPSPRFSLAHYSSPIPNVYPASFTFNLDESTVILGPSIMSNYACCDVNAALLIIISSLQGYKIMIK